MVRNMLTRKRFVKLTGAAAAAVATAAIARPRVALPATPDATIEIAEIDWEVRPGLRTRIKTYGGVVPGRVLRFRDGQRVAIQVRNRTAAAQSIHWHGLTVSPAVDGTVELGTPVVAPHGSQTYNLDVTPAGTRWYHSHYGEGLFSGMFGPLIVEPRSETGAYDQDIVLVLHEFKESILAVGSMTDHRPPDSPTLSAPAMSMQQMNSMGSMGNTGGLMNGMHMGPMSGPNMSMRDAQYAAFAVNGKALGAGEPIRVKLGQRVRFRIINASATITHRLALPGHRFLVIALDGNAVPNPLSLDAIELGASERVDAIVTMDRAGMWILGSTIEEYRAKGAGIVIEYAGSRNPPVWRDTATNAFEYHSFGIAGGSVKVDGRFDLVLRKSPATPDAWSINGQRFPNVEAMTIAANGAYLIRLRNMSMMEHPMHVHGHLFELVAVDGRATRGVLKDTVVVRPMMGSIDVVLRAENRYRGRYLFHCHNQQHADGGMATIFAYVQARPDR
jgi:FtsP/CotA-like multicopper oxidase with cupredoxin domain